MLDAVLKYGDTNKSGNKVIELDDSKLMTRASTVCEVDTNLVLELKDAAFDRLRELWNNDMLLDSNELQSIDVNSFLSTLNANFNAECSEENQINFTKDDLESTSVEIKFNIPLIKLLDKLNYDIVNTYFNHEDTDGSLSVDIDKTRYKNYILTREAKLNIARLCKSQTLTINDMKKNTFNLNIGEEALIEGFGVIKCIESNKSCNNCCLYDGKNGCKGILYNNLKPMPCYSSARKIII